MTQAAKKEQLRQDYLQKIHACQIAGKPAEALPYAEELSRLDPENGEFYIIAGMLHLSSGNHAQAIASFIRGLNLDPANSSYRTYFINAFLAAGVEGFNQDIKHWLTIFLREPHTVPIDALDRFWHYLLVEDPACAFIGDGIRKSSHEDFRNWLLNLSAAETEILTSEYILNGLRIFIAPDTGFEIFLTRLRRAILDHALAGPGERSSAAAWLETIAPALAEYCFNTEYVFPETGDEAGKLKALARDETGLCALACYRPLYSDPKARKAALALYKKGRLNGLVRRQILEPEKEAAFRATIPALGKIRDETSRLVGKQYEENPYPRWVSVGLLPKPPDPLVAGLPAWRNARAILVAGCGTGSHPIGMCLSHPGARITAIDLSLASLAYARRKSGDMGIENLELMQADILNLGKLGRTFDIIDCAGVLHHMKDPEQGWKVLRALLNPGGLMRIALYSKTARGDIIEAQNEIKKAGIFPTLEGIRSFRQSLAALPPDHRYRIFMQGTDYYSTSMVRDLLFHVQEDCFTIPRIKEDLRLLDLEFIGFSQINATVRRQYNAMFPDDPGMKNLDYWHQYERLNPYTFISMYKFWTRPGKDSESAQYAAR